MLFPPPIVAQTDPLRIGGNKCIALPVGVCPWDEADDRTTIVVKATYGFDPQDDPPRLALLAEQPPLLTGAEPSPRPGALPMELAFADDLVRAKPQADVLLVGNAYAAKAQDRIDARIAISDADGDHAVKLELCVIGASPVPAMPLGGGFLRAVDGKTRIPPVGPIQPREITPESERRDEMGLTEEERRAQYAAALAAIEGGEWKPWEDAGLIQRAPESGDGETPPEVDEVPDDDEVDTWQDLHETVALLRHGQQFAAAHLCGPFLEPDATISLLGLTPSGEQTTLQLPGHDVLVIAEVSATERYDVAMEIDTLQIDTSACQVSLTWRGQVPVDLLARMGVRLIVTMGFVDRVPTLESVYRSLPRGLFSRAQLSPDHETVSLPQPDTELAAARQMTFGTTPEPILELEAYAAIAAEVSVRPDEREAILARHDLDAIDWMLEERAWASRIGAALAANEIEAVDAFNKLMTGKRREAEGKTA